MKLKIKVTNKILEASKLCGIDPYMYGEDPKVGSSCAIALACREIFPNAWVTRTHIHQNNYHGEKLARLPIEATNFIIEFDSSDKRDRVLMDEIEFEVHITNYALSLIKIDEITEVLKNSETLELV
jgi:hypothetical protein